MEMTTTCNFYIYNETELWYSTILLLDFDLVLVESHVAFYIVRRGLGFRVVPRCDLRHLLYKCWKLRTIQYH